MWKNSSLGENHSDSRLAPLTGWTRTERILLPFSVLLLPTSSHLRKLLFLIKVVFFDKSFRREWCINTEWNQPLNEQHQLPEVLRECLLGGRRTVHDNQPCWGFHRGLSDSLQVWNICNSPKMGKPFHRDWKKWKSLSCHSKWAVSWKEGTWPANKSRFGLFSVSISARSPKKLLTQILQFLEEI